MKEMFKTNFFVLIILVFTAHFAQPIINGDRCDIGSMQWSSSLNYQFYVFWNDIACGAVIVNRYWAITAAHCFYRRSNPYFYVLRADRNERNWWGYNLNIYDYFINPLYNDTTHSYDIALIELKDPFWLSTPIKLIPKDISIKENSEVKFSGYGDTEENCSFFCNTNLKCATLSTCLPLTVSDNSDNIICARDIHERQIRKYSICI